MTKLEKIKKFKKIINDIDVLFDRDTLNENYYSPNIVVDVFLSKACSLYWEMYNEAGRELVKERIDCEQIIEESK